MRKTAKRDPYGPIVTNLNYHASIRYVGADGQEQTAEFTGASCMVRRDAFAKRMERKGFELTMQQSWSTSKAKRWA